MGKKKLLLARDGAQNEARRDQQCCNVGLLGKLGPLQNGAGAAGGRRFAGTAPCLDMYSTGTSTSTSIVLYIPPAASTGAGTSTSTVLLYSTGTGTLYKCTGAGSTRTGTNADAVVVLPAL